MSIESLVTFADFGDWVTLQSGPAMRAGQRTVCARTSRARTFWTRTLALLRQSDPRLSLGAVELERTSPSRRDCGGGSADAAAFLRAVRYANPERAAALIGTAWPPASAPTFPCASPMCRR